MIMDELPALDLKTLPLSYDGNKPGRLTTWATKAFRAKVPGGWFVVTCGNNGLSGLTFYPDPKHEWNGGSLD